MASADRPDGFVDPNQIRAFVPDPVALARAIDNVLVANHTLRHSLADDLEAAEFLLHEAGILYRESRSGKTRPT